MSKLSGYQMSLTLGHVYKLNICTHVQFDISSSLYTYRRSTFNLNI